MNSFSSKSGKYFRLSTIFFLALMLGFGGVVTSFDLSGFAGPGDAQAVGGGQTLIVRPELRYRATDKQFISAAENKRTAADGGIGGIYIQNQTTPGGVCNQFLLRADTNPVDGSTAEKARLTFDAAGNIYVVWHEREGDVYGSDLHFAKLKPDCSGFASGGGVNGANGPQGLRLGLILGNYYHIGPKSGSPDITYSPSEDRLYLVTEFIGSTQDLYVFSTPASTANLADASKWTLMNGGPLVTNTNTEVYSRIVADNSGNVHATFNREMSGCAGYADVMAVDLIGGFNNGSGTWNTYGGTGKNLSQEVCGFTTTYGKHMLAVAPDGTAYSGFFSPTYSGSTTKSPASIGIARYDLASHSWTKLGDNVINASTNDYTTLGWLDLVTSHDNSTVYVALATGNPNCALLYTSNSRGAPGSFTNKQCLIPLSYSGHSLGMAQGNNQVCVLAAENTDYNDFFSCTTGGGTDVPPSNPLTSKITAPANGSTYTLASNSTLSAPITISWNKLSGGDGSTVNYYVEYLDSTVGSWQALPGAFPTTATSTSAQFGGYRYIGFRVRASDSTAGDAEAAHSSADTTILLTYPPVTSSITPLPTLTYTTSGISLSWSGSGGNTSTTGLQYTVKVQDLTAGTSSDWLVTGATSGTYPASGNAGVGLANGHQYRFQVLANDANGGSNFSNPASNTATTTTVDAPIVTSMAPLRDITRASSFPLSWSGSGGYGALNYIVQVKEGSGNWQNWYSGSNTSATYPDGGNQGTFTITSGNTLYFRVFATDSLPAAIGGPGSNYDNSRAPDATTQVIVPLAAPTALAATPVTINQVNLSWTNNSGSATSVVIERKTGANGVFNYLDTVAAGAPGSTGNFSDTGVSPNTISPNTTYYYRVKATNDAANNFSPYSGEASALTAPAVPTNLAARNIYFTQVNLAWSGSAANFRLQRKLTSAPASSFADVALIPGATSYQDTGLSQGTSYDYQIRAENATGNSAYTGILTVVTLVPTYTVTKSVDDGLSGSLTFALSNATVGQSILITATAITVPGNLPAPATGVTIVGSCGASGPAVTVTGTAGMTGLKLTGGIHLFGVRITGFSGGKQITTTGYNNFTQCVAADH